VPEELGWPLRTLVLRCGFRFLQAHGFNHFLFLAKKGVPSAAVRPAMRLLGSRLNQVTNEKQLADLVEAAKLKLSAESSQKLNAVSAQKVAVETLGG
jgi:hypothetical protein